MACFGDSVIVSVYDFSSSSVNGVYDFSSSSVNGIYDFGLSRISCYVRSVVYTSYFWVTQGGGNLVTQDGDFLVFTSV